MSGGVGLPCKRCQPAHHGTHTALRSTTQQTDKNLVWQVLWLYGWAWFDCDRSQADREVVLSAVKKNGRVLQWVSSELQACAMPRDTRHLPTLM
jgi:hypothetical protein